MTLLAATVAGCSSTNASPTISATSTSNDLAQEPAAWSAAGIPPDLAGRATALQIRSGLSLNALGASFVDRLGRWGMAGADASAADEARARSLTPGDYATLASGLQIQAYGIALCGPQWFTTTKVQPFFVAEKAVNQSSIRAGIAMANESAPFQRTMTLDTAAQVSGDTTEGSAVITGTAHDNLAANPKGSTLGVSSDNGRKMSFTVSFHSANGGLVFDDIRETPPVS
ncbi:hypothetical protein SAMN04487916_11163 [Arthrobacter sp. ov407]|uniref:hypothetical protein n=1 Tax=Arthrobacter sp. ov407 TaxID=1761748 RepID=UPI00089097D9|nr:hypothetical protein [Arthrobacter sp. ov407]SDL60233.1 hypothetical protein SAMN04487916_11163 [Arthrobacter sp. ov407]